MSNFSVTLQKLVGNISEQNYDETLAQYCFWLDLGTAHGHIHKDQVDSDAWRIAWSNPSVNDGIQLVHPTLGLFFQFIGDMEDKIESQCASDYHKKRCTEVVAECLEQNLGIVESGWHAGTFLTKINLIARWANFGYVEEAVIRNHILQSLSSHPKLHKHQADALIILFRLAGATFNAYVEPSTFERCFQLLQGRYHNTSASSERGKLIRVSVPRIAKGGLWAETNL